MDEKGTLTNKQIKENYFKVKEICEQINKLLDKGYIVFDEKGRLIDDRWRFEFKEPPWRRLANHIWCNEITLRISERCTVGYFDPDVSWEEAKTEWAKWKTCNPRNVFSVI